MNPKHIILTLLIMLCPIGMAAQSNITRNKPKPGVAKPKHKPYSKPTAKPKAKTVPHNSTPHSGSPSSNISLSVEINKLINYMVYVEGGTFTMGGTNEQGYDALPFEKPIHNVTLSSYYICKYEVTQALWQVVMGNNPSNFKGDELPVESVSWDDCQKFITRINSYTGRKFRLPTEAEWEFAARGGKYSRHYKYSGSNYIDDVAWYNGNSGYTPHPVGSKLPNELGLYDMSGNVLEWCSDWYDTYNSYPQTDPQGPKVGSYRVIRGGCWWASDKLSRLSFRIHSIPSHRDNDGDHGLRLVLSQL